MKKPLGLIVFSLVLISLFAGCAEPPAEEALLGHWEKIVGLLFENRNDAPKAAAALNEYFTANLETMKNLILQVGSDAGKEVVKGTDFILREARVRQMIVDLETSNASLLGDASVKAALDQLGGLTF